jgi:S-layer homology domain
LCALFVPGAALAQLTSTQQNPTIAFTTPGAKQVTLQVCTAAGLCGTVTKTVVVLDPVPHITSLGSLPAVAGTGQTITLSAQTSGRPALDHQWTITGPTGSLTLAGNPASWNTQAPGIGVYQVTLQVRNTDGSATSAPVTVDVERMSFADVPPTYWAWSSVETLYANGITSGCGLNPRVYCPGNPVSRAEMAVFLVRAMHGATFPPPLPVGIFSDVAATYWAAPQIEQFYADGITSGCSLSPLRFCPGSLLSRAEMAIFLLRARHGAAYVPPPATGTKFADVAATYWAAPWIEQLAAEGITNGCATAPLRFCPDSNVSRDQMAAFLVRTFGLTGP